jgi:hypothetical protein
VCLIQWNLSSWIGAIPVRVAGPGPGVAGSRAGIRVPAHRRGGSLRAETDELEPYCSAPPRCRVGVPVADSVFEFDQLQIQSGSEEWVCARRNVEDRYASISLF